MSSSSFSSSSGARGVSAFVRTYGANMFMDLSLYAIFHLLFSHFPTPQTFLLRINRFSSHDPPPLCVKEILPFRLLLNNI